MRIPVRARDGAIFRSLLDGREQFTSMDRGFGSLQSRGRCAEDKEGGVGMAKQKVMNEGEV